MNGDPQATASRLPLAIALLGCALLALASLPASAVPPGWLLAFTLPAALLAALRRVLRQPWQVALVALGLQTAMCYLAIQWIGPLSRPAALACTILPPLAYVTVRRQDTDASLSLFLSFCVLLVGFILDRVSMPMTCGFVAAACLALRCAASDATRRTGREPAPRTAAALRRELVTSTLGVLAPCLVALFAIERSLVLLPSPSRAEPHRPTAASGAGTAKRTGLTDKFSLDSGSGVLELQGDRLIRVRRVDGSRVADDLYLRSGFFAAPGLDSWELGALDATSAPQPEGHQMRRPQASAPEQWLAIERFAEARNLVFVPPSATELRGLGRLVVDDTREWVRQRDGAAAATYSVAYQPLPEPAADLPVDPRSERLGLLSLPDDLDRAPFAALLDEWRVGQQPLAAAERIAEGLGRRCRYDLRDPSGPFDHALLDFLFADGDRHGYCMHFASAAALMLRLRGIPCRIGVGLYGGRTDPSDPRTRIYGSQHAHAWVEIPFVGRGYVVFDPTPASERGRRGPENAPADAATGDEGPTLRERLDTALTWLTAPWALAGLLALVVGIALWPASRGARSSPATESPRLRDARRQLQHVLRALADAGCRRRPGETLEAFAQELAGRQRLEPAVAAAFRAYQEVRFGGRPLDAARERQLALGRAAAAAMAPVEADQSAAGPTPAAGQV